MLFRTIVQFIVKSMIFYDKKIIFILYLFGAQFPFEICCLLLLIMKSKGELSARDVAPKAQHSLAMMTSQPFVLSYHDGLQ